MFEKKYSVNGAGLGLRRVMLDSLEDALPEQVGFLEVAPENWIEVGGKIGKQFDSIAEQIPITCHGLSLNIGGTAPLDEPFLYKIKHFLDRYKVPVYSDHLTYCADDGHLYDLLPIPFTEEAVKHVAGRIKRVQDILERRIAIENASFYAAPSSEMTELTFIQAVLEEADCDLLLDVNNIYVNSVNHRYDPVTFLQSLPGERIAYAHIAGHYNEYDDLIVDTHGSDVIDPVWQLLECAYETFGVFPSLLERDFNIPEMPELLQEVDQIIAYQAKHMAMAEALPDVRQA